ncbi:MAG TPA: sigma-70 family RNA polymerase sigma factor [Bryobacteraceae bacterium]|jgi:RNA polymerase sigma factor (TIGR02999 family)|nr:sigma-70 family RNA polymerase sigma factor [Bryobacteraceae bacterium]
MDAGFSLTERLRLFLTGHNSASEQVAIDALMSELLPRLREIAMRELKRERYIAPLTRTELIGELWASTLAEGGWQIESSAHFYALAGLAMRHILVDLARKRIADRRGGGQLTLSLEDPAARMKSSLDDAEQIVTIGILMDRLELKDADAARMVDMHYFGGFTVEEIASKTGLSLKQVRSRSERGMKWLKRMLHARRGSSDYRIRIWPEHSRSRTSGAVNAPALSGLRDGSNSKALASK